MKENEWLNNLNKKEKEDSRSPSVRSIHIEADADQSKNGASYQDRKKDGTE